MKKTLAVLLSVLLLIGALPLSSTGAEIVDSGTCGANGDNLTWTLDEEGTLTISGTGAMRHYSYSDDYDPYTTAPWGGSVANSARVKTVVVEDGVTSIGSHAFYLCAGLTSVTIPASVTSIGSYAFSRCWRLTGVYITDLAAWCGISFDLYDDYSYIPAVPNPLFYANNLYLNGELVQVLTIPDSVKSIGDSVFYNCTSLTSVTIPDSVTGIESKAFFGCTGLTSVTIPDSVTSIGESAFSNTAWYNAQPDGLVYAGKVAYRYKGKMPENTSVVLQNDTRGIAVSAFSDCTGLTSVTIPDSVTSIGSYAFRSCSELTTVTIPDGVTSIEAETFSYCKKLTTVTFPAGLKQIGQDTFNSCSSLRTVNFKGTKAQWKTVEILSGNEALLWAEILCTPHTGDHVWDGGVVLREATCVKPGLTCYTCTVEDCGATEERETPVTGVHAFGEWTNVLQPVCGVPGADIRVCADCAKIEVRVLPATGKHSYTKWTVVKSASCVEGLESHTCEICGEIEDRVLPVTGIHTFGEWKQTKAPTCGDKGAEIRVCSVCGDKETREVKATGVHTFGEWTVTTPAAVEAEGEETRLCAVCGEKETRPIPALPRPEEPTPAAKPGDVDGDGKITAADARLALRRAVDLEDYPEGSKAYLACDVDKSNTVTAADARLILRAAVELEDPTKW